MNEKALPAEFWNQRYRDGNTGWDIGSVSTPLESYIQQLSNRELRILIPGAGKAHEAEFLHQHGFHNTFVLDYAEEACKTFHQRVPDFPTDHVICEDFFEHRGQYDLIFEQTFFCALHPSLREKYAEKMLELLTPGGKLVGLFFNVPLNDDRPPFGGSKSEYEKYFKNRFFIRKFEEAYNSIDPRYGNELFAILVKPE